MYFFSIFEKRDKKKIGLGFFKIFKYTCFNIWKGHKEKTGRDFFKICKYSFS